MSMEGGMAVAKGRVGKRKKSRFVTHGDPKNDWVIVLRLPLALPSGYWHS